jgi:hypothetical protein
MLSVSLPGRIVHAVNLEPQSASTLAGVVLVGGASFGEDDDMLGPRRHDEVAGRSDADAYTLFFAA